MDGKISNHKEECSPISSDDDRNMLYNARVEADAVMIGANTLRLDDSGLTVKSDERRRKRIEAGRTLEPTKIVIITDANKVNLEGDFFNKGEGKIFVFSTSKTSPEKIEEIKKKAKVFVLGENRIDLDEVMYVLFQEGIGSVLVEGGGELIASLLKKDLVDEIRLKIGDLIIGGRDTATLVDGEGFDILDTKKVKFESVIQKKPYFGKGKNY